MLARAVGRLLAGVLGVDDVVEGVKYLFTGDDDVWSRWSRVVTLQKSRRTRFDNEQLQSS